MGTTVTPNLGLIKPDEDEKIQADLPVFDGWATQNAANMDAIDALFRASTSTYTITVTATTTPPTIGATGFTEGKYIRLYPRLVIVFFRIFYGVAGFAAGNGEYRINLPFTMDPVIAASDGGGRLTPFGKCVYRDNSLPAVSSVFPVLYSPIPDRMVFGLSQGNMFTNTSAEASDRMSGYFMYPTADA